MTLHCSPGKTNCLTYTPKNINLTLSNGTLTLKAGSKLYIPNGFESDGTTPKFNIRILTEDMVRTKAESLYTVPNAMLTIHGEIDFIDFYPTTVHYSGPTAPSTGNVWYDTTNNLIKVNIDGIWTSRQHSLPIGLVNTSDTDGFTSINQVFDWCGYIGSTAFVLPGVKGLIPNGFNTDGIYKNIEFEIPNVSLMDYSTHPTCNCNMYLHPTGLAGWINTDDYRQETFPSGEYNHVYIPSKNEYWYNETGGYMRAYDCLCGTIAVTSGKITSLTPYSVKTTNDSVKIKDTGAHGVYFCPGKTNCLTYTPKNINLTLDPLNVTVVGSPTINNGIVSGFSSANHLRLPKAFNPGTNSWEVVVKFTMGSSSSNNQVIFESTNGGGARAISIYFGHSSKKLVYCISGDTATNNILSDVAGANTIAYSTTYWVKLSFNGSSYVAQISTNGTSWVNDITKSSTVTIYSATTGLFGYFPPDANTYCFSGSVDLPNSYIKINGSTWWKGGTGRLTLKEGSKVYVPNGYDINTGIVGYPTINNGVVSGFSASNYLLTQNSVNLNSVNNFEIVVRAQYNTGSLLQQHSNAPYTIALRADIMLVRLSGDSGWTTVYNNTSGLITGNWYSFRASFDGSTYKFERAEDGGEYVVLATLENSTKIISNNQPFVLGTNDVHTDPYLGSIDLTQSYIKINGELWWQGKAGSGKPKFDEVVTNTDKWLGFSSSGQTGVAFMYLQQNDNNVTWEWVGNAQSGSSWTPKIWNVWYDTTNNFAKKYGNDTSTPLVNVSLPIAIFTRDNGSITSLNQIFDWCGYIGSTTFVLPGVKGLIPNGFNADGTYKSIEVETDRVLTIDASGNLSSTSTFDIGQGYLSSWATWGLYVGASLPTLSSPSTEYKKCYITSENKQYYHTPEFDGWREFYEVMHDGRLITDSNGKITSLTPATVQPAATVIPIKEIYNGSQLVYQYIPSNTVFFESATPGTYTFTAPRSCTVSVIMVGAGGGAAYAHGGYWESTANGGSAGMITGTMNITKGTSYSIVVGAGGGGRAYEGNDRVYASAGGATTFAGQTAGGGGGANAQNTGGANAGTAGVATITISTLNASNGVAGSTASRYGSYGGGGVSRNGAGQGGYIRIAVA